MTTSVSSPVFERLNSLGDATRGRILFLLEEREFSVGELVHILQLPQSSVSRHLKVLADDGWLSTRVDGRTHYHRLDPELDRDARALWSLVREELRGGDVPAEDRERARSVLAERVDRSREFFSDSAGRWDELRGELYGRRADLLPLFGLLDPAWTVADLGAGTGQLARAVAPFVRRVVAVDRSTEMLEAARQRMADLDNVELRQGDLESLPLEAAEADVAILSLVLHFVMEPPAVLAETARILPRGGRVVLVDMRAHERQGYREEMGHVWPGFRPEQLEAWLERAGFEDVTVAPIPPDPGAEGPLLQVATARKAGA